MKNVFIFSLFVLSIFFSSCCLGDKAVEYEYLVTNDSNSTISVNFVANQSSISNEETMISIEVGQTLAVLNTSGPLVSACERLEIDENQIDRDLISFDVINADSLISSRDYLMREEWDFDDAIYTVSVSQAEF